MIQIKRPARWIAIALILCLISAFGSHFYLTDNGKIAINELNISIASGETIHLYEFRPANATVATPAPAVVFSPGNDSTLQSVETYGMELARRGIVAYLIDMTAAGMSSPVLSDATVAFGLYDIADYVYSIPKYVDNTRIGIGGFSKGGKNVYDALTQYGKEQAENPDTYFNKIKSAYILDCMELPWDVFPTGVTVGFAIGSRSPYANNWTKYEGHLPGEFAIKDSTKKFINSSGLEIYSESEVNDPTVTVEMGKIYGSVEDGTGRVFYNPEGITHILAGYSSKMSSTCVQFFSETLGAPIALEASASNAAMEIFMASLGIIGIFILIAPLTCVLLDCKFFASLKKKEDEDSTPALTVNGTGKTLLFFLPAVVLSFVMPLTAVKFGQLVYKIFDIDGHTGVTRYFINAWQNSIALWLTLNGLIALGVAIVSYILVYKKQGITLSRLGISVNIVNALKAVVLGFVVFAACYLLSGFAQYTLQVDFRLCDLTLPWMTWDRLLACLRYTPFIVAFWCVSSISNNALNRIGGMNEKANLALCVIANLVGIVVVTLIHYYLLMNTGAGLNSHMRYKYFYLMMLFVPITIVGVITNRIVYNKTHNVFVGPLAFGVVISILSTAVLMLPDFVY